MLIINLKTNLTKIFKLSSQKGGQFPESCQQLNATPGMDILSVVCIFFYLGKSWAQEQTYVVSAPKVFYVGASENVVIQVHGYTDSFAVTIAIKSYPDKSFTYSFGEVNLSPENKFQSSVNLTMQPKDLSGGPNAVSYVYLEVVCDHFSKATKIPLRYDNGFILIQTDKSVYNSDESVKVRIYSLDEDLKPSQREVTITFIDPAGSEVAMVGEKNYTGIITFPDFKIPVNPKYGSWTIKAKYKEDFTTTAVAMFEVKTCEPSPKTLNLYLTKSSCIISASTFKHPLIQKCCYDGAFKSEESCEQRAAKITLGPRCSRAFSQCCELANQLREESSYIHVMIGRDGISCKLRHDHN
uniref:Anaphylatoxin-like domain-containing protein n=1 Tax=Lynx canadensis TaxID=61383 RepID=A0A667H492_LYNCA